MASSQDPRDHRPFVGMDDAPVRCQMESSFLSILHSAGLEEWAAQQSELANWQTGESASSSERTGSSSSASEGKSNRRAPSSRSAQKSSSAKQNGRSRKSKDHSDKSSRAGRSKHREQMTEEEKEEMRQRAASFVPDYSGYNTMDAELSIIGQQLKRMREHP
ncbi:hypothetical protein MHUMG1_08236 [Metarhizium humberi]|uniref:Uncharacterized protein n=4 Tax=Metarhizium TaxID=5529 RepID=A0A9P8S543_9HYPO